MYAFLEAARMALAAKSMILIVFLVLVHDAVRSHFRGGYIYIQASQSKRLYKHEGKFT